MKESWSKNSNGARMGASAWQTLDDLRGKRISATVPDGFSGWLTVWAELKRRGIDPEQVAFDEF